MELYEFFKSVIDMDTSAVVICDLSHKIVYMNPAAAERYKKSGGYALVGSSLLDCHNKASNEKIRQVVEWFGKAPTTTASTHVTTPRRTRTSTW